MRIPKRRNEKLKTWEEQDEPLYLTPEGHKKLKRKLERLKRDLPAAIADVKRTAEFGDFSENAEYQQAKATMRRMHTQILATKEKLKRVIELQESESDTIQLGSHISLKQDETVKEYHIVGPYEADPTKGRISHKSPLGKLLIGRKVGEIVDLDVNNKTTSYEIVCIH